MKSKSANSIRLPGVRSGKPVDNKNRQSFLRSVALSAILLLASQLFLSAAMAADMLTAGSGTAQATSADNPSPASDSGQHPPAGTQVAFVRDDQIYLVNSDGSGLVQLTDTEDGVVNTDPAWSRDGRRLAFARTGSGSSPYGPRDIYIMNADGSNVVRLTNGGSNVEPSWAPDGRKIVYSGSQGLSVIDTDADAGDYPASRTLLDYPGWDAQPAWSPDGRSILFSSDHRAYDILFDVYTMTADGSDVRSLFEGPFAWVDGLTFYFQPAWSPDGQSIAVVVCPYAWDDCYTKGSEIAVANADGSGQRLIAQAGSFAKPTWSPDGQWIAYGSSLCRKCQSSVRYVRVDGGTEGLIIDDARSPAWRPDTGSAMGAAHSGAWYNPATSGQGQFLDVVPDQQLVFLGWFTYTDDESGHPNEQHWFTAEGQYDGTKAELILYETLGGRFNDPQAVTSTPVGDVTLTFSSCGQGTMTYRFDQIGIDHSDSTDSFPMMRAIPGTENACEGQTKPITEAENVNQGMDGAWFDAGTSGQGFFFDVHAEEAGVNFIFVSWFTYGDDTGSGQRWLTAEGHIDGSTADLVIYDTHGGSFNNPQPAESVAVGTMSIDFSDCSNALLAYTLDDEQLAGEVAITRLMPGGDAMCEQMSQPDQAIQ